MRLWWVLSMVGLLGCAASTPPLPTPMALPSTSDAQPSHTRSEAPVQPFSLPSVSPRIVEPLAAIAQANQSALIEPTSTDFLRSVAVFPYQQGALYRVDTALQQPTTIMLQPGEEFLIYASGDMRFEWKRSEGIDPVSIVIMATRPNLRTRTTLVTSLGVYGLDLRSHETTGMAFVSWKHPPAPVPLLQSSGRFGVGYGVRGLEHVAWKPLYAWNDDRHTYLLFSERMWHTQVPVIHLVKGKTSELVNHQSFQKRSIYKINRLLDEGEVLQLGVSSEKDASVQVLKTDTYRQVTCPGSEECDVIQRYTPPPRRR